MSAPQSARYEQPSPHRGGETSPLTTGQLKHLRIDKDREYVKRARHRAALGRVQCAGPLSPINKANREATPLRALDTPQSPLVEDDLSLDMSFDPIDTGDMLDQFDSDSFLSDKRQSELSFVQDTNSNYYAGTENMEKEAVSSTGKTGTSNVQYNRPDVQSQKLLHSVIPKKKRGRPRKAEQDHQAVDALYKENEIRPLSLSNAQQRIRAPSPAKCSLGVMSIVPIVGPRESSLSYQTWNYPYQTVKLGFCLSNSQATSTWEQSTPQITTFDTEKGAFQVPDDVQAASKLADEKHKRNPGASARFRKRRDEKKRVQSTTIAELESQIRPSSGANTKAGSASLSFDPSGDVGSDGHNAGMQVQGLAYHSEEGQQSRLTEADTDQISKASFSTAADELSEPRQVEMPDVVVHRQQASKLITQMAAVMNAPILYSAFADQSSSSSVLRYETVERGATPLRLQEIDATEEERRRAKEEIFKMLKQWTTCDLSRWTNEGMECVKADMKGAEGISAIS